MTYSTVSDDCFIWLTQNGSGEVTCLQAVDDTQYYCECRHLQIARERKLRQPRNRLQQRCRISISQTSSPDHRRRWPSACRRDTQCPQTLRGPLAPAHPMASIKQELTSYILATTSSAVCYLVFIVLLSFSMVAHHSWH